ncbi:hypothetical protein C9374_000756 [Naegleria lovaniensis]|uniref:Uncharacterized protein n=1 Tax=Naegleria lovaniensis TaxID=51637 RepID=A0AA88GEQ2_NAELO|nr:uncharacterized protein C9374_013631 [Naegleria lovaniensis]XP_044551898.1 uncharacterized protein C9374_000756 [Naegleria lovaniensis]KAG2372676.1 hypothetical protein C9374_013631 [Naegleria lovaniensis]KAG2387906.1 hypothetical protein C9374_000756 [Naegleria lovaniensis]
MSFCYDMVLVYGCVRGWQRPEFIQRIKRFIPRDLVHTKLGIAFNDDFDFEKQRKKWRPIKFDDDEIYEELLEKGQQNHLLELLNIDSKKFMFVYDAGDKELHLILRRIHIEMWKKINFDFKDGNVLYNEFADDDGKSFYRSVDAPTLEEIELLRKYSEKLGKESISSYMCLRYEN